MENKVSKNHIAVISKITGILVKHGLSAKEVIEILKEVETTFLERSWHVASDEQHAKKD